jgi:DNA-binding NarL/FixJ family response regulator
MFATTPGANTTVARDGTVLDPEVVRQLLGARRRADSVATHTPRVQEVLSLMALCRFWHYCDGT